MNKNLVIGGFVGYFLIPIVFIIGIIIGIYLPENFSLSQDNLSSIISAIATVIIAILTIVLAKETWELRQIQLEEIEKIRTSGFRPSVSLFFKISPVSMQLLNLHIINSGAGSAFDIKFKFENIGNKSDFNIIQEKISKISMVNNGLSSLFPNEDRRGFLLSFLDSGCADIFKVKMKIIVSFTDLEKRQHETISIIDFSEYEGIHFVGDDSDPLYKISDHLKKIEPSIKSIANNTQPKTRS